MEEVVGMYDHLDHYPAGDYNLQMLVAVLCTMVAGLGGAKQSPYDFAPWLRSPEERKAIKQAEEMRQKSNQKLLIQRLPTLKREKSSA